MKISNAEIYNATEPLKKLLKVKLPIRISYTLVQLVSKLRPQMDVINQVREKLIMEHGERDEKRPSGKRISPEMLDFSKFAEEFGDLLNQEYEMEDIPKIRLPDSIEVEPYILMALERFVELDEEPKVVELVPIQK